MLWSFDFFTTILILLKSLLIILRFGLTIILIFLIVFIIIWTLRFRLIFNFIIIFVFIWSLRLHHIYSTFLMLDILILYAIRIVTRMQLWSNFLLTLIFLSIITRVLILLRKCIDILLWSRWLTRRLWLNWILLLLCFNITVLAIIKILNWNILFKRKHSIIVIGQKHIICLRSGRLFPFRFAAQLSLLLIALKTIQNFWRFCRCHEWFNNWSKWRCSNIPYELGLYRV